MSSPFDELDDGSHSSSGRKRYRPSGRSSKGSFFGVGVFLFLGLLAVLGIGGAVLFFRPGPLASVIPAQSYKQAIDDYLQKNLNDPSGLEYVEWQPPEKMKDGNTSVVVKIRAKNAFGAKMLHTCHFVLRDNKVIAYLENDDQ